MKVIQVKNLDKKRKIYYNLFKCTFKRRNERWIPNSLFMSFNQNVRNIMKVVLLMDLANVKTPLDQERKMLDPIITIRNLRNLPDLEKLVGLWAFADYQQHNFSEELQRNMMAAGFQLVHAPRLTSSSTTSKSTDDAELVAHADWLLEHCDTFDTVLLASGDRDFLRVSQRFLNHNKKVLLVDPSVLHASRDLRNAVDGEVSLIATVDITSIGRASIHPEVTEEEPVEEVPPMEISREHTADEFRAILTDENHRDHEQLNLLREILTAVDLVLRSQAEKELPTSFTHLLNVLKSRSNYRTGKIPLYEPVSSGSDRPVPVWVDSLGEEGIRQELSRLVLGRVLVKHPTPTTATYEIATDHPFYLAVSSLSQ